MVLIRNASFPGRAPAVSRADVGSDSPNGRLGPPVSLLADIEALLPRARMPVSRFNSQVHYQNLVEWLRNGRQLKPATEKRIRTQMRKIAMEAGL